jgi:hypothetical protein
MFGQTKTRQKWCSNFVKTWNDAGRTLQQNKQPMEVEATQLEP